jgi:PqqD family protein of HPr-rel-A system
LAEDHDALRLRPQHWRLGAGIDGHWRAWDDDVVVYHDPTASTHRLAGDTAAVFVVLAEAGTEGLSEQALFERLGGTEDTHAHFCGILDSLRTLGLAESRGS